MSEEMYVDAAMDEEDCVSEKMNSIERSDDKKASDEFEDKYYVKEVCSCDVEASEESKTKKHSLLKQCDEINKQNDVSFISDIKFGSDDDRKSEEKYNIIKQYSPTMKMVFRHKTSLTDDPELLFDINMIKSKPNKDLKELDSLETVNKLFTFGNLNDIHITHFSKHKFDPMYNIKLKGLILRSECDEKSKPDNCTLFKTGQLSLDYDNIGCDYSNVYTKIINIIYSNLKQYFMNLCNTLPSYDNSNTKVVGLLYSGGKDSTCRLLELLERGESVVPIVNTLNSHNSTDLLLRDIATVYNLSKVYKTNKFKGTLYKPKFLTYLSWNFDYDFLGLTQQPYNMMSLTVLGRDFLNNCKRIECCLINGDMGVSYISEMTKLYKTAMKFNYNVVNGNVKSIPPLVFPYTKMVKDNIIDNLERRLDNIMYDKLFYTIIPTCQEITVRSIKIAFSQNKYWLYISLENCENCAYCKTHSSNYYYTLCVPLSEAKPVNKNDIVLSSNQIYAINSKFSNIFRAY